MKKLFSIMLALMLVLGLVPTQVAFADDNIPGFVSAGISGIPDTVCPGNTEYPIFWVTLDSSYNSYNWRDWTGFEPFYSDNISSCHRHSNSSVSPDNKYTIGEAITIPDSLVGSSFYIGINYGGEERTRKVINVQDHSGGTATCTSRPICEKCGREYGSTDTVNGHNWKVNYNSLYHWEECSRCGVRRGEETNHIWNQEVQWEADRSKAHSTIKCDCGYSETDVSTAAFAIERVEPKCTQAGSVTYKAVFVKLFHNAATIKDTIPAEGHTEVTDPAVPATCTEPGKTKGSHCSVCNTVLKAQEKVPAKGHSWSKEVTYDWNADNSKVTASRSCLRDPKHVQSETVKPTKKVVKKATCTKWGQTKFTATFKNTAFGTDSFTQEDIEPLGHSWGEWKVTKQPTATKAGEKQRVCKHDATHIQKKSIPATGEKKVSGTLLVGMTAKGKDGFAFNWTKISGADGYDVFLARCNHTRTTKDRWTVKTLKGDTFSWTKNGLKKHTSYKARVKAWVMENGKKKYVFASPTSHGYTGGYRDKYTNPGSVIVDKTKITLKVRKTRQIKAMVTKLKKKLLDMPTSHAPKLRYTSSNSRVAAVNGSGKVTAKTKGNCTIYVYAANGASKTVKVTVK